MKVTPWLSHLPNRLRSTRRSRTGCDVRIPPPIQKLESRALLTVSSVLVGTELSLLVDDGADITVQQDAVTGNVQVTANGTPVGTIAPIAASDITVLTITADDRDNVIDLSPLTIATFSSLTTIRVDAGDGDDNVTGSDDFGETFFGQDGNDTLTGGGGADTLDGGDGNDQIDALAGANSISGGDGNDTITSGADADTIDGGDGQDSISSGAGADSVLAGQGSDTVLAGTEDDFVNGGTGDDVIVGDAGRDTLEGGNGADSISGGDDPDVINGQGGNDTVDAGAGNDTVRGARGNDLLNGDAGMDILNGQGGNDTITGGADDDRIFGGGGADVLFAELQVQSGTSSDNDTVLGQGGNDILTAFLGADILNGGSGNDLLQASAPIPPDIAVDSVVLAAEGDSGLTPVTFTITLSRPSSGFERVDFATSDGTAIAGSDYVATSGSIQFLPGETARTASVDVIGDGAIEGDEFFFLNLSNAVGVNVAVTQGSALITDDDPLRLFAVFSTGSNIVELDPNTGAQLNSFATPAPTTFGPDGIAYDGNSVFFLAGNSTIFELDPDTGAIRDQDNFTPGSFDGIATLNNNVYLMNFGLNDILIFDTVTDTITGTLDIDGVNPGFSIIGGLGAVVGNGPDRLVATDFGSQQVHEIDPVTGQITFTFSPGTPGAGSYFGVAGINGEIYLGSSGTQNIDVFTRQGTLIRTMNIGSPITALGGDGIVNNTSPPPPPPPPPVVMGPQGDTLRGGSGRDTVLAGDFDDLIVGGGGRDSLNGGGGNDSILGGSGNDTLDGGSGFDTLDGQGGNDRIIPGTGDDTIRWMGTGSGRDSIAESPGSQTLIIQADASNNTLVIDANSGRLRVTEGTASITASEEINIVSVLGGSGADTITILDLTSTRPIILIVDGEDGKDTISAQGASYGLTSVQIRGGNGNDTIDGSSVGDRVDGGAGDDVINGNGGDDTLFGGEDNDTIAGASGDDVIDGGTGNDRLQGDDGDDSVLGRFGNDVLTGGDGNDTLNGGFDNDNLSGGVGDDSLVGEQGRDTLLGAVGNDILDGGTDSDTLRGHAGNDSLIGGDGDDRIFGNSGADVIDGGDGDDRIDAGNGNDIAFGGDGNDIVNGMTGRDTLLGGDGNDSLIGGTSVDFIFGGDGSDGMTGNASRDRFNGGLGTDTISDLEPNEFDDTGLVPSNAVLAALAAPDAL